MNTLALTVDVEYVHVKARAEAPPHYLAVYLDRSWTGGRSVPVKAAHWHDDRPLTMRATVEGRWARHAQIPRDAQLCFQATTTTMNRNDVPCQQECGALNLPLAELLAQHAAQPGSWTKETLRVHTSRHHLAKGTVRVRVHSVALTGADALTFGPATPTANLAANVDGILGIFNRYLADYEREDKQFQIVFPGSARINCPLTPSEQTVANTQVCVPFAGYMRYEVPATEPGWWAAQMLVRDARLHGGTGSLARYGRYVAAQPAPQRANEWLQVCAQYTQQLPYVGDRTAGEPVEMFFEAKGNLSGDCEDLGCAINQDADALEQTTVTVTTGVDANAKDGSATLALLREVGREYVRFQPIYEVSSTDVQASASEQGAAHSAVQAMPRDYVGECVARWQPLHPMARMTVRNPAYKGKLDVLTGEGTGLLTVGLARDPVPSEWREAVYDDASTGGCAKKELFQPPAGQPSDFYKAVLFGACRETLENYGIGTWRFAYRLKHGRYSKGVRWEDLVARSDKVVLVPYGYTKMERALTEGRIATGVGAGMDARAAGWPGEFSDEALAALRAVTKTRMPPPTQTAPPAGVSPVDLAGHPILNSAVRGLPGRNRATRRPVHTYYAPQQLTPGLGGRLRAHLARVAARYPVVGHAVAREWHSAGLPEAWRVTVYFDDEA